MSISDILENREMKERVELHCHTTFSKMNGVLSVEDIFQFAKNEGMSSVAFTDCANVYAYPFIQHMAEKVGNIKPIYGLEAYVADDLADKGNVNYIRHLQEFRATILVKNEKGLRSLYKLITNSNVKYYCDYPIIPISELMELREDLMIGSGDEGGLLAWAIQNGQRKKNIEKIARLFDYIEIQPECELSLMELDYDVKPDNVKVEKRKFNDKLIRLGEKLDIPVVAVSNAFYLRPQNEISRKIVQVEVAGHCCDYPEHTFFRTTKEMLAEFAYLGEKKAYEIVVENSNRIAGMIDKIKPFNLCDEKLWGAKRFSKSGDYERLVKLCNEGVAIRYGISDDIKMLPERERRHLQKELDIIKSTDTAYIYLHYYDLIHKNHLNYTQYSVSGAGASMFVCYLLEISHVNPLSEDVKLYGEFLVGLNGERIPDIDINVDSKMFDKVINSVSTLPGVKSAYQGSEFQMPMKEMIDNWIKKYPEKRGAVLANSITDAFNIKYFQKRAVIRDEDKQMIFHDLKNVIIQKRMQPGRIVIIPEGFDETLLCPVESVLDETDNLMNTLQFDYFSTTLLFENIDITKNDICSLNSRLYELTGYYPTDDDICSDEIMILLTSTEGLGIANGSNQGIKTGLLGIPGFMNPFMLELVDKLQPKNFAELVKVEALNHGINTWVDNAEVLVADGKATINELIGSKEDIYETLLYHGIEKEVAYKITEGIRKGNLNKGRMDEKLVDILRQSNLPEWFIESCEKIKYVTSRANAAEYVQMELRALYYKLKYPHHYYSVCMEMFAPERVKRVFLNLTDEHETDNSIESNFEYNTTDEIGRFKNLQHILMTDKEATVDELYFATLWNEKLLRDKS